ncbi:VapC toxin family PIN domain ribonuclease [Aliifodinibius salipaludis]|uniref:VapC toxin family PIN domain ribonuclease n=1 Tax=Fodinibius salipaludis TaxID=2032627 RepID=A0A2A2G7B0_9BACT|nr:PIN domain nuclease [Aliifodinibius salipaludis]PAU92703.1 VapC toxin family PIN domain ribonuclease [Aliifodinibius salipaludis]
MILVDTSVWIDYFNGVENKQTESLDRILSEQSVLLGDIILTEILQGFDSDKEFRLTKQALEPLDCVHLGGKSLAIKAASNFRFLRSKGVTIRKTVDMLIGSWCIEHEVELLHNDKDFDQIAIQLPLQIYTD